MGFQKKHVGLSMLFRKILIPYYLSHYLNFFRKFVFLVNSEESGTPTANSLSVLVNSEESGTPTANSLSVLVYSEESGTPTANGLFVLVDSEETTDRAIVILNEVIHVVTVGVHVPSVVIRYLGRRPKIVTK